MTATIDFFNVTAEQLKALGWATWSRESDLYLCPASQFASLPDGIALWSIGNVVCVKGRDYIDDDTRGGMLAYGIRPGHTRTDLSAHDVATRQAADAAAFTEEIKRIVAQNGLIQFGGPTLYGEDAAAAIDAMAAEGARTRTASAGYGAPEDSTMLSDAMLSDAAPFDVDALTRQTAALARCALALGCPAELVQAGAMVLHQVGLSWTLFVGTWSSPTLPVRGASRAEVLAGIEARWPA